MIDNEDRNAIGQGAVRLAALVFLILVAATVAGLALRLFQIVSGI